MTAREQLQKAVRERDATVAGAIADQLRFVYGLNYDQTFELVKDWTGLDAAEWATLMSEADWVDGHS
jgi:hypothetical protein